MAKLRIDEATQDRVNALSQALTSWLQGTAPTDLWQTCATCERMGKDRKTCTKFNAVPPVDVVVGNKVCPEYIDEMEIPF